IFDPKTPKTKVKRIFSILSNAARRKTFHYKLPKPPKITWFIDKKHGPTVRFWFQGKLGREAEKDYYWRFYLRRQRWVAF
ncbi:MAG: hypothetical protein AAGJ35_06535, partial [Myxococcota bacterium]